MKKTPIPDPPKLAVEMILHRHALEERLNDINRQMQADISIERHTELLRQASVILHRINVAELRRNGVRVPQPEYEIFI